MDFFNSAVDVLQTLVIALGAGLGIWGVINLLEGYGNDNPGAKIARDETAHGGRRCGAHRYDSRAAAQRAVRLSRTVPHTETLRPCPPDAGGGGKGGLTHWI